MSYLFEGMLCPAHWQADYNKYPHYDWVPIINISEDNMHVAEIAYTRLEAYGRKTYIYAWIIQFSPAILYVCSTLKEALGYLPHKDSQ